MALRRKCNGAKHGTEALAISFGDWVGERSLRAEGVSEGMLDCSEVINADMSNDKICEKHIRRKPEVSWVKVIFPGLVGS